MLTYKHTQMCYRVATMLLLFLVAMPLYAQKRRSALELSLSSGLAAYTPITLDLYPRRFKPGFALDATARYHFHRSAYAALSFGGNSNQTLHNIYLEPLSSLSLVPKEEQKPLPLTNSRSNYHLALELGGYYYQSEYFRLFLEGGAGVGTLLLDTPTFDQHHQRQKQTNSITHLRVNLATGIEYFLGAGLHVGLCYDAAYLFRADLVHTISLRLSYRLPKLRF